MKLKKDDKAPSFELYDQDNRIVKLIDFEGHKLLLYFYPKALTFLTGSYGRQINIRNQ
ncbi:MAG: redoxin domain-containing protein [Proteobacteria bacterium]|nr:redoxin domain-containing protein [Pseudomonadota bacterium]